MPFSECNFTRIRKSIDENRIIEFFPLHSHIHGVKGLGGKIKTKLKVFMSAASTNVCEKSRQSLAFSVQ